MPYPVDTLESLLLRQNPEVFELLLKDHSTSTPGAQVNIIWATDSYADRGEGYAFHDQITTDKITGDLEGIIKPRSRKDRSEQISRTKDKAEVFTPSWVCNLQNNLIDEAWFGREEVFNTVTDDGRKWIPTEGPVAFPEGKTWKDYIRDTRLEISCGEAPYLVSRYDTVTGELIPIPERIGMLDRKLRVVSENTRTTTEWLEAARTAYQNILGFEWQGDNLLLAREALYVSFLEYFEDKFGTAPTPRSCRSIAYVISWNLFQMDGLRGVVPGSCHDIVKGGLFNSETVPCPGCTSPDLLNLTHNGIYCLLRDWGRKDPETGENNRKIRFIDLYRLPTT